MADSRDSSRTINLTEYKQLRGEINNRTQLSAGLVALQLTALGAGIFVMKEHPAVVIALTAVSSFLWLLWIDHTSQIYKIAFYIGMNLAPRLREEDARVL